MKPVNPEHGEGARGAQPARTRVRRPSEERAGGGEGRGRRGPGEERAERGVMFKRQMYSSTVV